MSQFAPDSVLFYLDSAQSIATRLDDSTEILAELTLEKARFLREQAANDTALVLLEQLYSSSIQRGDRYHSAMSCLLIGEIHVDRSQLPLAKPYLEEALSFLNGSDYRSELARVHNTLGVFSSRSTRHEEAQIHLLKAKTLFDSLEDKNNLALVHLNIGSNYMDTESNEEAVQAFNEALVLARETKDTLLTLSILNDLGIAFRRTNPDSALAIYRSALAMIPQGRFIVDQNRLRFNLANILSDQGDTGSALDTFRLVYRTCKELGIPYGIIVSASGIGEIRETEGDLPSAREWVDNAIQAANRAEITDRTLAELMAQKARILRKSGDHSQAFDLKLQAVNIERALSHEQKQIHLLEMEKAFDYEKRVSQNEAIKARLRYETRWKYITLLLFIGILGISVIMVFLLRQRRMMTVRLERAYHKLIKQYRGQLDLFRESAPTIPPSLPVIPKEQPSEPEMKPISAMNLADRLEVWLSKEKPFLDPKFRVESACDRLQTNAKALALALKQHRGANFNTLINRARVHEAMRLMSDPEYAHYKVEFIGYRAGFGTKQTFYTAFEQETGLTPGFYRSGMQSEEQQTEEHA